MPLTLSVINIDSRIAHSNNLEVVSKKVFTHQGGTIGRSPQDDWVLPDPQRYVSSHHAIIEFNNDDYFIIDTSMNGVYVNNSDTAIGKDRSIKLNSGDRIHIGDYEISVEISPELSSQDATNYQINNQENMGSIPFDSDPLDLFGVTHSASSNEAQNFTNNEEISSRDVLDHTPNLDEYITPPEIEAENLIPDDWALTQTGVVLRSGISSDNPERKSPSLKETSQNPVSQHPESPSINIEAKKPVRKKKVVHRPKSEKGEPIANNSREVTKAIQRDIPNAANRNNQQASSGISQNAVRQDLEFEKLLKTLGIDRKAIPPELEAVMPEIIGLLVRESISGLIDVLMARTSMKSAFRVDQTMIQPTENNPLKFSVGVDEAIENMLLKKDRGYLPALEAVREGFSDIKSHQMATMAGMQGALQDILHRLDPDALERQFNLGSKGNIFSSVYNKIKYWEHYKELYSSIIKESKDNFQSLLSEGFMRAYEDQIIRMARASSDKQKRNE